LAEKAMGLKAKTFTADWTARHQTVFLKTIAGKDDKYGRILAQIYSDKDVKSEQTACLNEDIVSSGYARAYFGAGDKTWDEFKK
jgi:endonuclease YncB( thermonuclease family)